MTVTCCPLSGGHDDGPSCSTTTVRTARKAHVCCECHAPIQPGEQYEYTSGIWDREPNTYKTCSFCREVRNHFACDGWIFERLWDDLAENFLPTMRAGGPCIAGLSPDAKGKLFAVRTAWKLNQPNWTQAHRAVEGATAP